MQKSDLPYVGQMLDYCNKAVEMVDGVGRAAFDEDEKLKLALSHLVQIIGEAARRTSDDFRAANSQIPWSKIVGMRHRIVHDYTEIDEDILWSTVTEDLKPLAAELKSIVPSEPPDSYA